MINFDYASAVPPSETAMKLFLKYATLYPYNQEASGGGGIFSALAVKQAEHKLLDVWCGSCHAENHGVLPAFSGTDAIHAGFSIFEKFCQSATILYTDAEHPAVLASLRQLSKRSFMLKKIRLTSDGTIDLEDFEHNLDEKVLLVCLPWVQSETGVMQPLREVRKRLDNRRSKCLLFVDSIQGAGKLPFPFHEVRPDFTTISGQKFGCPAGAALIYPKKLKKEALSLRFQEHVIGRVSPAFTLVLADVLSNRIQEMEKSIRKIQGLKQDLLSIIHDEHLDSYMRLSVPENRASPFISHFILKSAEKSYQGAIIVRYLSSYDIHIAAGSACSAETKEPSAVLRAMGCSLQDSYAGLRISIFDTTTKEEIAFLVHSLAEVFKNY